MLKISFITAFNFHHITDSMTDRAKQSGVNVSYPQIIIPEKRADDE